LGEEPGGEGVRVARTCRKLVIHITSLKGGKARLMYKAISRFEKGGTSSTRSKGKAEKRGRK